jgi:hypothetical protein
MNRSKSGVGCVRRRGSRRPFCEPRSSALVQLCNRIRKSFCRFTNDYRPRVSREVDHKNRRQHDRDERGCQQPRLQTLGGNDFGKAHTL